MTEANAMTNAIKARVLSYDAASEYFFHEGCFITELSNSAADPDVSIARARLQPGKTTRWHLLRGTCERYVVLEGEGAVEIEGLPTHRVSAGDVVVIPPQARQRIRNTGTGDLIFLAICSPRFTPAAYVDVDD